MTDSPQHAGGETATQLADAKPQIDTPIRIMIPASTNAPPRVNKASRDDFIRTNAFSPSAFNAAVTANVKASVPNSRLPALNHNTHMINNDADAKIRTAIHDYTVLAFSSQRANQPDVEAAAYISLAVIYDNMGNFRSGIENYKLYLKICNDINDIAGQAVAHNCLGVNYMLLACPPSDMGLLRGYDPTPIKQEYLTRAIQCHQDHIAIADAGGQFVAHTNLGLCYALMGDITAASRHQQDALRIAIKMQTLYGQSIAVGNLGMLAMSRQDYTTARTCFEQHLQLVQSLQDAEGEINAWKLLAEVSSAQDNHPAALDLLEHARRVAVKNGFNSELKRILCLIGISRGISDFPMHAEKLIDTALKESGWQQM